MIHVPICVLDASVLINILATGEARDVLRLLPYILYVEDHAFREVQRDPSNTIGSHPPLSPLVSAGDLGPISLKSGEELSWFIELVATHDLGDGEAGGIAISWSRNYIFGTDDRKAIRVAAKETPVSTRTTVSLFRDIQASGSCSNKRLLSWVDHALRLGRMRVFDEEMHWIRSIIGGDKIETYQTLCRTRCKGQFSTAP
jgi:hypothetical protein